MSGHGTDAAGDPVAAQGSGTRVHPGDAGPVASAFRLLDLFCGAGGAGVGYAWAGWEVTAVDIAPQPHNPFMSLIQDDALLVLADLAYVDMFDAVHLSPPCQHYTSLRTLSDRKHPDLVGIVRDLVRATGKPYVIENVVGAPLIDPIVLCGSMFGLGFGDAILKRHRLFESNVPLTAPADDCKGRPVVGVYGTGGAWTRIAPAGGGRRQGVGRRRGTGTRHRLDDAPGRASAGDPARLHRVHWQATQGRAHRPGVRMTYRRNAARTASVTVSPRRSAAPFAAADQLEPEHTPDETETHA